MAREVAWVGPASAVESVRVVQAAVVLAAEGALAALMVATVEPWSASHIVHRHQRRSGRGRSDC